MWDNPQGEAYLYESITKHSQHFSNVGQTQIAILLTCKGYYSNHIEGHPTYDCIICKGTINYQETYSIQEGRKNHILILPVHNQQLKLNCWYSLTFGIWLNWRSRISRDPLPLVLLVGWSKWSCVISEIKLKVFRHGRVHWGSGGATLVVGGAVAPPTIFLIFFFFFFPAL